MTRAGARMVLVALSTLALYGLALLLVNLLPGADIVQPYPIWWTGAFAVAVAFAGWNVWDSLLDARAAFRRGEPQRIIAGGLWRLRSDALQGACCTAMAGAGALAIVQWGGLEGRTALISVAALALVANQVWNRVDRERVMRMPPTDHDARYHELRAQIRLAEAAAALQGAEKHDALTVMTRVQGRQQMLLRILEQHGIAVPEQLRKIEGLES